jgi:hypothetical protein
MDEEGGCAPLVKLDVGPGRAAHLVQVLNPGTSRGCVTVSRTDSGDVVAVVGELCSDVFPEARASTRRSLSRMAASVVWSLLWTCQR